MSKHEEAGVHEQHEAGIHEQEGDTQGIPPP
jgi:hypothetical protein